jgi:hypothetical protein
MTYESAADQPVRDPWVGLELELDRCVRVFGTSPCLATGEKCYNTRGTCRFRSAYSLGTPWRLRFSSRRVEGWQETGQPAPWPTLVSVDLAPTVLDPGRTLGLRGSLKVTLADHPSDDYLLDPYAETRAPTASGTLWGRLVARHRYIIGRPCRLSDGFLSGSAVVAGDSRLRLFRMESIDGPDSRGQVTVVAKDPLRLADGLTAQVPLPSEGRLRFAVDASVVTFELEADQGSAYTAGDWVRVGDEVCEVTDVTDDTLTVVRGALPAWYPAGSTEASSHDAGDTVQVCALFNDVRIDVLVAELLTVWAGVPSGFIDTAAWASFTDTWLSNHSFRALITKPTSVKSLLDELSQHLAMIWWDDRAGELRLDAVKGAPTNPPITLTDDDLFADSPSIRRDDRSRISQVWLYYGQRSPVEDDAKAENYASVFVNADLDAESSLEFGEPRIKQVFSRWLPSGSFALAAELASRMGEFWRDAAVIASVAPVSSLTSPTVQRPVPLS